MFNDKTIALLILGAIAGHYTFVSRVEAKLRKAGALRENDSFMEALENMRLEYMVQDRINSMAEKIMAGAAPGGNSAPLATTGPGGTAFDQDSSPEASAGHGQYL